MMKKIALGAVIGLAVLGLTATTASANCGTGRTASTYAPGFGYTYWHAPSGDSTGTLIAQVWQLGGTQDSTNNCTADKILYFGAGGIGLNANLGDACFGACPANLSTLAVYAAKTNASGSVTEFLIATQIERPERSVNWDYSDQGPHTMIAQPRPRLNVTSRVGTTVNLSVSIDPIAGGLFGVNSGTAVQGYIVKTAASSTNPGRNASAYGTTLATIAAPGGTAATGNISVDCSNPAQDQWVVTQLNLQGGNFASKGVSEATRVNCNPALADPTHFKIIDKKPATKPSTKH